jgi:hypothetical protein
LPEYRNANVNISGNAEGKRSIPHGNVKMALRSDSAEAIHQHLGEVVEEKAMIYSMITRTLKQMSGIDPEISKG